MAERRNHAEDLSRYWDALTAGEPSPDPGALDPEEAAFVLTMVAHARRAQIPAGARERARDAALRQFALTHAQRVNGETAMQLGTLSAPAPLVPPRPFLVRPARPQWWERGASIIGVAALIVAMIGGIFFTFREPAGTTLPAVVASPTAVMATPIAAPSPAAEWPALKGNAAHTSAVDWSGPSGNLRVRWTFDAPGAISAPAAAGDAVYLTDQQGTLFAMDAATGKTRWTFATGAGYIDSSHVPAPAVANGRVFVPGGDGTLYAIDAVSGTKAWSHASGAVAYASPVVVDSIVYFLTTKAVLALDTASGAIRWQQAIVGSNTRSQPAVADGLLVYGNDLGALVALNAATGATKWNANIGHPVRTPTIAGGRVLITTPSGPMVVVDAATGKEAWRQQATGDSEFGSPAVIGDTVVTTMGGATVAYDLTTGSVRWQTANLTASVPVVAGKVVYVPMSMGAILELDLATGKETARVTVADTGAALLAVMPDAVYVSAIQTLTALEQAS